MTALCPRHVPTVFFKKPRWDQQSAQHPCHHNSQGRIHLQTDSILDSAHPKSQPCDVPLSQRGGKADLILRRWLKNPDHSVAHSLQNWRCCRKPLTVVICEEVPPQANIVDTPLCHRSRVVEQPLCRVASDHFIGKPAERCCSPSASERHSGSDAI